MSVSPEGGEYLVEIGLFELPKQAIRVLSPKRFKRLLRGRHQWTSAAALPEGAVPPVRPIVAGNDGGRLSGLIARAVVPGNGQRAGSWGRVAGRRDSPLLQA